MSTSGLSTDEQRELTRLRAQVAALEAERRALEAERAAAPHVRRGARWRTVGATIVIVLGCLLAPLSVVAVWLDSQVTDTDAYVETVAPLIEDPRLQEAMAQRITTEVFDALDVEGVTTDALTSIMAQTDLPPRIEERAVGLAVPISSGVQDFLTDQVNTVVASPQFAATWTDANRLVHQALVTALTGKESGTVQVEGGTVSINLAPFVDLVKQRLVDRGVGVAAQIPEVDKSFVIVESEELSRAQGAFSALNTIGTVMPFVVLVVLAAGVLIAVNRRRALVAAGIGVAVSMLVLALAIMIARSAYLGGIPPDVLPRGAAASVFDTLVRFLRTGLRAAFVLGVVVALVAYLTGPSAAAVGIRRGIDSGIGRLRALGRSPGGLAGERVGGALATYRHVIRVTVVLLAGLVILLLDRPTAGTVIAVAVVTALVLVVVEALSAPAAPAPVPAPVVAGTPGGAAHPAGIPGGAAGAPGGAPGHPPGGVPGGVPGGAPGGAPGHPGGRDRPREEGP